MDSQTLSLKPLATMDDLKQAIHDVYHENESEMMEEEQVKEDNDSLDDCCYWQRTKHCQNKPYISATVSSRTF